MHINEMTTEDLKDWLLSEKQAFDKRKEEKREQHYQNKMRRERMISQNQQPNIQ